MTKQLSATLVAALIALSTAAQAETSVTCAPFGSPDSIAISSSAAQSDECGQFLDSASQPAQFCQWQFPYRSKAAKDAYLASETALDGCFNKQAADTNAVNHPDSYDQLLYTTDEHLISLSLKDKAQLNSTFLFLRIEAAK